MKISSKEKRMLMVLGSIIGIFLFKVYVYDTFNERIAQLEQEVVVVEKEYNQVVTMINEKDKMLEDAKKTAEQSKALLTSNFTLLKDEEVLMILYNSRLGLGLNLEGVNITDQVEKNEQASNSTENSEAAVESATMSLPINKIVDVNFTTSSDRYFDITTFVDNLRKYPKQIKIQNIDISGSDVGIIKCSTTLVFYQLSSSGLDNVLPEVKDVLFDDKTQNVEPPTISDVLKAPINPFLGIFKEGAQ